MDHDNTFYDSLGGSARLKHAGLIPLVLFFPHTTNLYDK
jgi:hypothetical protein